MKKTLIFGANSILTKELANIHQNIGDKVIIAYHSKPNDYDFNQISLKNSFNINEKIDIVYILSACLDNNNINELCDVNVKLIHKITQHFKESRIIHFSSIAIYDGIEGGEIDSNTAILPKTLYGTSKYFGEKIVEQHSNYGIVRISSLYGIGMKENTFLPRIINSAINKKTITIYGDGSRLQNYTHKTDVAKLAYQLAISKTNKTILAVHPQNYSNLEVAELITHTYESSIELKGEDTTRSITYKSKDKLVLQHQFKTIEEGIKEWIQHKIKQY